jgi:type IV pilus assembly protein PilN
MIKVNLFPGKKKKRAKPLPTLLIATIFVTLGTLIVMAYLTFFFSSRLSARKDQFAANEQKIAELKATIKAVEDFEQRNKTYKQRNEIIEQLSKNKSLPVKILDEISALLPTGIWLQTMTVSGESINLEGTGFTNPEIVAFVDNVKNSKLFTEVYLQESVSKEMEKIPLYTFKLIFKLKI